MFYPKRVFFACRTNGMHIDGTETNEGARREPLRKKDMKKIRKKRSPVITAATGFVLSAVITAAVFLSAACYVKAQDTGSWRLLLLLYLCLVPGCVFFTVFLRRRLRMRGAVCGLIGGALMSSAYLAVLLAFNGFRLQPAGYLLLPFGVTVSVIVGVLYANYIR